MEISLRKTLNDCKMIDFEEGDRHITVYLEDANGNVYAVNIIGKYDSTNLIKGKEAALEGPVQAQPAKFVPEDSNGKHYKESEKCNFSQKFLR